MIAPLRSDRIRLWTQAAWPLRPLCSTELFSIKLSLKKNSSGGALCFRRAISLSYLGKSSPPYPSYKSCVLALPDRNQTAFSNRFLEDETLHGILTFSSHSYLIIIIMIVADHSQCRTALYSFDKKLSGQFLYKPCKLGSCTLPPRHPLNNRFLYPSHSGLKPIMLHSTSSFCSLLPPNSLQIN